MLLLWQCCKTQHYPLNRLHTNTNAYVLSVRASGLITLHIKLCVFTIDNRARCSLVHKHYLMQRLVWKPSDCERNRLQRTDTDLHRRAWKVKACIIEKWDLKILRMWKCKRWPSKPSYGNTFFQKSKQWRLGKMWGVLIGQCVLLLPHYDQWHSPAHSCS